MVQVTIASEEKEPGAFSITVTDKSIGEAVAYAVDAISRLVVPGPIEIVASCLQESIELQFDKNGLTESDTLPPNVKELYLAVSKFLRSSK